MYISCLLARFERICSNFKDIIRLLCKLSRRLAFYLVRKDLNKQLKETLSDLDECADEDTDFWLHEEGYDEVICIFVCLYAVAKEFLDSQIDRLHEQIAEAQTLRDNLEQSRIKLLECVPPWSASLVS
ncbi:hypothetical protein Ciccas_006179 [Cichlidogyrus casuarinus]|uniref:Uncharacterized protein n=1 Tax=Cichlidogyrus casuarinus TaxID=1844966 RepID=A0ABD2Q7P8_9PLAT